MKVLRALVGSPQYDTVAEMRFLRKISKQKDGCWIWIGCKFPFGYGEFKYRGQVVYAHIWLYERTKGKTPEGLELDHLCRNPSCVNPDHLEPVTHKENLMRGIGVCAARARQTHCKRGHPLTDGNFDTKLGYRRCLKCLPIQKQQKAIRESNRRNLKKLIKIQTQEIQPLFP